MLLVLLMIWQNTTLLKIEKSYLFTTNISFNESKFQILLTGVGSYLQKKRYLIMILKSLWILQMNGLEKELV